PHRAVETGPHFDQRAGRVEPGRVGGIAMIDGIGLVDAPDIIAITHRDENQRTWNVLPCANAPVCSTDVPINLERSVNPPHRAVRADRKRSEITGYVHPTRIRGIIVVGLTESVDAPDCANRADLHQVQLTRNYVPSTCAIGGCVLIDRAIRSAQRRTTDAPHLVSRTYRHLRHRWRSHHGLKCLCATVEELDRT